MDGFLKSNLDIAKSVIQKDWDMVFLTDGAEGAGKSLITQQEAKYCDPTFNISRIAFTPEEFKKAILKADKYQAVIYDEAYTGLSSRETMSHINRALVSMLAEIRQKNLFVFIVMPTFFDLDRYVALWRSRALLHIYTGQKFERGYFAFFNYDKKKELYVNGKKYYSYAKPRSNFHGRFYNKYTVDEKAYRRKKLESLRESEKKDNKRIITPAEAKRIVFRHIVDRKDMNITQKCDIIGWTNVNYYYAKKKLDEERGQQIAIND